MHTYVQLTCLNIYGQGDESSSETRCGLLAPQARVRSQEREDAVLPPARTGRCSLLPLLSLSSAIAKFIPNAWSSVFQTL